MSIAARKGLGPQVHRVVTTPLTAGLLLLLVYVGLSFLNDPMGGLGTDTGGKVATLEVMAERPLGLDPDVGYWASQQDPDAEFHGLYYTSRLGDRFVNVTTLPMLELGAPLYRLGGYRAALLLPMAGAIAAAFAGRALATRVGGDVRAGWITFWVLGLASPLAVYALDFWEHTLGVALLLWGFGALLTMVDSSRLGRSALWGLAAGLAFGAAYSMRTEALVYGFVATAVVSVYLLVVRRWREAIGNGAGVVVGLAVTVLATTALEVAALGETFRSGRASSTAGAGGIGMELRLKEAIVTGGGLVAGLDARDLILAAMITMALLSTAYFAGREGGTRIAAVSAAIGAGLFAMRLGRGPGFIPGMLATTPLVAVGVARMPVSRNARLLGVIALGALPLVWLFQFTGGAGPQWGGRYILASGAVLAMLGVVALSGLPLWGRRYFVIASVAVTLFGLMWLVERSHEVGRAAREVAAFPEDAVVSTQAFWLRELGAVYEGESTQWLSLRGISELDEILDVLDAEAVDSLILLGTDGMGSAPTIEGFEVVGERTYTWLGPPFTAVSFDRNP